MSHITNESEDGGLSMDQSDSSPLIDEGNCGGNSNGGIILKKGPWTSAEDAILIEYVKKHGEGNWNAVQKHSGLFRCGKSCRLRWANHLRPNLKKGAFTPEEERLIIELHAKMGNKWARMAAHLPGRTDNEIKNYWNTRIKRRQRAGLPLYPPEVCLQAFQENHQQNQNQNPDGVHSGDKRCYDLVQTNYEIPDVIFDSLKSNQAILPYAPNISDNMFYNLVQPKRSKLSPFATSEFDDENRLIQRSSFDLTFYPFEPTFCGENFSASKSSKLELPSLQYPETADDLQHHLPHQHSPAHHLAPHQHSLESVDAFIQSPPRSPVQNSGLLDALLQEAKNLGSGKSSNQLQQQAPYDKGSNASSSMTLVDVNDGSALNNNNNNNICSTEWDDYGDPISPLGNSAASIFSECTPISATGSSLEEGAPADFPGCNNIKSDTVDQAWNLQGEKRENATSAIDFSRPDTLLGSCWVQQGVKKENSSSSSAMMTEAIAALLGDGLGNNDNNNNNININENIRNTSSNETTTISTSTSSSGWGFGACNWNNMPPVCQMTELP